MASHGDDNDTDDLYSEDYPELKAQGILVHDPNLNANKLYPHPSSCLPRKRAAHSPTPSPALPPQVHISKEYQSIIQLQKARYKAREKRCNDLENLFRASLHGAIQRREKQFEESAIKCLQGIQADFIGPMTAHDLVRLSRFPDLLFRYFQNQRRVAGALCYMKMQVDRVAEAQGLSGGSTPFRNHYDLHLELRCILMVSARVVYEHLVSVVLSHIGRILLESSTVQFMADPERLTLFDPHLAALIISDNHRLSKEAADLEQMEVDFANHRFGQTTRWTGMWRSRCLERLYV